MIVEFINYNISVFIQILSFMYMAAKLIQM